jgi:hypothetical protein
MAVNISAKDRLAKVRALHQPAPVNPVPTCLACFYVASDDYESWFDSCDWPCATAEIVYTRAEIASTLGRLAAEREKLLAWLTAERRWMEADRIRAWQEKQARLDPVERARLRGRSVAGRAVEMTRQRATATPVDPLDVPIPYAVVVTAE